MVKVTEAIEYAHQRGVIHRDMKPANILLDAAGNPAVTDFGLAKKLKGNSGLTGSGQIMGTPSYMPPEQAGGNRGEVGPAADVYALGATLYALLTGRPPFQAASVMDTVLMVISDEPVPPRRLNASVPRDLEVICLKCLEKDPGRRYGTADALAGELGRWLPASRSWHEPVGNATRLWMWCRCRSRRRPRGRPGGGGGPGRRGRAGFALRRPADRAGRPPRVSVPTSRPATVTSKPRQRQISRMRSTNRTVAWLRSTWSRGPEPLASRGRSVPA